MNIEQLQPYIHARLTAKAELTGKAVILDDDGTYPKTPDREKALEETGLVLIVWEPESDGLVSAAADGTSTQGIYCAVVIEENVKKNRAKPGYVTAHAALRLVQECVVGRVSNTHPNQHFRLHESPFENFGTVNGVRRIVANFFIALNVSPN